jgi:hypothetical protein
MRETTRTKGPLSLVFLGSWQHLPSRSPLCSTSLQGVGANPPHRAPRSKEEMPVAPAIAATVLFYSVLFVTSDSGHAQVFARVSASRADS